MRPGEIISDRFEIIQEAGAGGMGAVYRAMDRARGQLVALKVLYPHALQGADRFAREAEALSELSHPGIVRYAAHGTTPWGARFLAMEWLDGEDLGDRLDRGPLSVAETLSLATRVASALGCAHGRGIVHRDI
ncbi:MAG: protein kinase, partial [Deltaproteobacteria bacterium]|nr:protein kinase [Deltaproteobacteria bacterium]